MEFRLEPDGTYLRFQRFEGRGVVVNEVCFTTSLVISPTQLIPEWPVQEIESLAESNLRVLLDLAPELALVGTGHKLCFPPPDVLVDFMDAGIGVEFMDSRAACRTFNILAAEGRNVAAGIILEK